jgi:hypothetical protein
MPRTATPAQSNSSRANGAQSNGPKTDAGKQVSSRNALKHGLAAEHCIIPGEDINRFNHLLEDILSRRPNAGELELSILRGLAQDLWRLERIRHLSREAHLLRITLQQEEVDEAWANPSADLRATVAMAMELGPKGDIKNFAVYESRIHRHLKQALQELESFEKQLSRRAEPAKNVVKFPSPQSKPPARTNEPEAASTPVKVMACGSSRTFVAEVSANPVANDHTNAPAGPGSALSHPRKGAADPPKSA